jgi:DNA repair protein RadC
MNPRSDSDKNAVFTGPRARQETAMIVATARDAANLLAPLFADSGGGKLVILYLDRDRRLLATGERPRRAADPLPLRDILVEALRLDATGLLLAHDRPEADPQPSLAEIEATRQLAVAALPLDIRLHDHLVFAGGACRSFRDLGLL